MKRFLFFLFFVALCNLSFAQVNNLKKVKRQNTSLTDTSQVSSRSASNKNIKNEKAKIQQYKIISYKNDSTYVDTTLSLKKDYKFNYLRRDEFGLMAFSNVGQTYNTLSNDFSSNKSLPLFGARARHFNYMEVEDINYYRVPTPLTELFYKTAFEQGQVLDAFFTVNTSERFNFSIAYKGLRSLGKYQHILTSTGNFRFTTNYVAKNDRYKARIHVVMQDLLNEENGGLKDEDIINFESGEEEFIDRSVFDPNFENAESLLKGKRFYIEHQYNIVKSVDSVLKNSLNVGNVISFEDKYFQYDQSNQNNYFGDAFQNSNLSDRVTLENFYSSVFVNYQNASLGDLKLNVDYHDYNYGYNNIVVLLNEEIKNRLKGNTIALGGAYRKKINNFDLIGEFGVNVTGDFDGNFLDASVTYQLTDDIGLKGVFNTSSNAPNYNHLLYQSDYINYNWDNSDSFENVKTQQLALHLLSDRLINVSFDYTNITNYTYFKKTETTNTVKPIQYNSTINYLRLKVGKELKYRKFALDNTIMYQNVLNGEDVLNVPQIITRNTLYYSSNFFNKALFLQTGVTFNYFTEYNMDAYDPLLAEFYTQNETKIGGFPRFDFFVNAKIRQTRIFFKLEHFNSAFTGYNYFSAPNYPYRDFSIRFGIVWNFFL